MTKYWKIEKIHYKDSEILIQDCFPSQIYLSCNQAGFGKMCSAHGPVKWKIKLWTQLSEFEFFILTLWEKHLWIPRKITDSKIWEYK